MYHCVQSLLSVRLKPELMLDGEVDRLCDVGVTREARTAWTDDEIRLMIALKAEGLTHEQVAVRNDSISLHDPPSQPIPSSPRTIPLLPKTTKKKKEG